MIGRDTQRVTVTISNDLMNQVTADLNRRSLHMSKSMWVQIAIEHELKRIQERNQNEMKNESNVKSEDDE